MKYFLNYASCNITRITGSEVSDCSRNNRLGFEQCNTAACFW